MPSERLQRFLSRAGVASRRKAETLITEGRVKVNNAVVTQLGTKVDAESDLVTVDGRPVTVALERGYYLLYKPPGCVTTMSDPQGRPTVAQYLGGLKSRVFPVGRLDFDAEGALLFTDDGDLANRLAHPRYGHRRTYLVKVRGEPPAKALERMVAGVWLEDGPAKALECAVHERAEKNVWIRISVGEGRYHLVKRLCEAVGLFVQRIFRPEFGGVTVDGLRSGQFRPLTPIEVTRLKAAGEGGAPPPASALPRAARRHGHGPPGTEKAEPRPKPERDEARPTNDRPKRQWSRGDGPRGTKPRGERSGGSGQRGKGPQGERSGGDRPRGERPRRGGAGRPDRKRPRR
jgi:23S rRNA pseudouridine2605 synthase